MTITRRRQFSIASLLGMTAIATCAVAFLHFKYERAMAQQALNRSTFYDRVVEEQATVTGTPLAKVVAMDSGEPVAGVIIGMTLIGADGGDGGFQCFTTQQAGIALRHLTLAPGRYQYHLDPDPNSRYAPTLWRRGQPYLVVANDGTTAVPVLKLDVHAGR
ncbi:MAG: hypothetical protein F9B45_26470 [Phycisphaera sp. RhM]|nr:hypothetical protein [Phycisphaera sp. RhM]